MHDDIDRRTSSRARSRAQPFVRCWIPTAKVHNRTRKKVLYKTYYKTYIRP